jgi:hypothetical protein
VENYFNYFTEIEEQFLRRRGGGLLLTTLDWALIETWKEAGVPLKAALRGIDEAFDRYDQRPAKTRKVNSLAYCAQAVLSAAEDMKEAAVGAAGAESTCKAGSSKGFEPQTIAAFLRRNADLLGGAKLPRATGISLEAVSEQTVSTLRKLALDVENQQSNSRLEDLERHLTVLEEKLFAALLTAAPEEELLAVRAQADRELAPYRSKMAAAQIVQLQKQYVHKRLLEKYNLPRLSLFYM